ncbi:MAG: glycoside hydrolase family 5 protein [Melioribacteraceae bacterium]
MDRKVSKIKSSTKIVVIGVMFLLFSFGCSKADTNVSPDSSTKTVVENLGALKVLGNKIIDKNNNNAVLRGMSLFWSQWGGSFYNESCVKWLRDDWKCTVVRASMGIESGGYLTNQQTEYKKVTTVIDACIKLGIYVIVDWHDHNAQDHLQQSKTFFASIAQKYGAYPNIIYEIYNEPLQVSWSSVIKSYATEVINTIRQYDKTNLIVVGSSNWSQDVDVAAKDPIVGTNIAYSLHFYTSTHTQSLRNKAISAMNSGVALFVTEYGISEASGDGKINYTETNNWLSFLETYKLSSCNWSIIDKNESSAALKAGASAAGNWTQSFLSESGSFIRNYIISKNEAL